MSFLHILLDLKELYQGLLGVGIGFVQPPPDPTGAQHPSAWVGPRCDAASSEQAVTVMFSHFLLKDTLTVLAVVVSVLGYSYPWWTTAW